MPTCWAVGCQNKANMSIAGSPPEKISFHRFPLSRPELLKRWLDNVGREGIPSKLARLCSAHFLDDCFDPDLYAKYMMLTPTEMARRYRRLKEDAVPTVFKHRWASRLRGSTVRKSQKRKRQEISSKTKSKQLKHVRSKSTKAPSTEMSSTSDCHDSGIYGAAFLNNSEALLSDVNHDHHYCKKSKDLTIQESQLQHVQGVEEQENDSDHGEGTMKCEYGMNSSQFGETIAHVTSGNRAVKTEHGTSTNISQCVEAVKSEPCTNISQCVGVDQTGADSPCCYPYNIMIKQEPVEQNDVDGLDAEEPETVEDLIGDRPYPVRLYQSVCHSTDSNKLPVQNLFDFAIESDSRVDQGTKRRVFRWKTYKCKYCSFITMAKRRLEWHERIHR